MTGVSLAVPAHARRLHPLTPMRAAVQFARNGAVSFVLFLVAHPGSGIVLGTLALAAFGLRCLQLFRTRYTLDDVELTVWQGILNRTTRVVSPARVQRVEVTRKLWHRVAGLAVVRVELAGAALDPLRIELDALGLAEAERVRDALERGRRLGRETPPGKGDRADGPDATGDADEARTADRPVPEAAPEAPVLVRLGAGMLALGGLTGLPMLIVPPFVVSGAFQLRNLFQNVVDDATQSATRSLLDATLPVLAALGLVLVAAWLAAAAGMMVIRYHGFRLSLAGDDVLVRHGLLETRTTVIPLRRVHLVDEHAAFARRWFDLTAITVRTASGDGRGRTVPVARTATVAGLPALLLRRDDLPTTTQHHPSAARRRAFVRRLAGTVPAAAVGSLGLTVWTAGAADLAVVAGAGAIGAAGAWWWARAWFGRLGHALHDGVLLVTDGVVVSHRRHVPLVRAQSIAVTRTPFQRRVGLCTVRVHLAGNGQVSVPDVSAEQALRIVEALPGLGPIDQAHWRARLAEVVSPRKAAPSRPPLTMARWRLLLRCRAR